jgi:hypothetical protein
MLMLSCVAPVHNSSPGQPMFQSFEFENDGIGAIDEVRISYSGFDLPTIRNPHFNPFHRVAFSETMTIPIPEQIPIHWVSNDSVRHDISVKFRDLVKDKTIFYGFKFNFVDDHVEIYLVEKLPSRTQYLNLKRTKVFPPVQ